MGWFGDILEKFGAMCSEVDGIVAQEFETVSANVKQFCTEVIQEVFVSASEDATEETAVTSVQNTYSSNIRNPVIVKECIPLNNRINVNEEEHSKEMLINSTSVLPMLLSSDEGFEVKTRERNSESSDGLTKEVEAELDIEAIQPKENTKFDEISIVADETETVLFYDEEGRLCFDKKKIRKAMRGALKSKGFAAIGAEFENFEVISNQDEGADDTSEEDEVNEMSNEDEEMDDTFESDWEIV